MNYNLIDLFFGAGGFSLGFEMAGFKTNVMRILDQKKITYTPHEYQSPDGNAPDGVTVASMIGKAPREVY